MANKSYGRLYNQNNNVSITPKDIYNLYPIGSIYISVVNTNPKEYFGGTWQSFGSGQVLVGVDTAQTEFNTVMKTGGEKTHTLSVDEMPRHSHAVPGWLGSAQWAVGYIWLRAAAGEGNTQGANGTADTGGGQPHNNLQPYITVYMWRRVA